MCLGVFIASASEIPLAESPDLSVQEVSEFELRVARFFSLPNVRYIGAHTGCSCGFPHVVADSAVEWYEGFFEDTPEDQRKKDVASVQSLAALIAEQLKTSEEIQLYPVWNGDEEQPSKGTIDLAVTQLIPERFFFNEQFVYRVRNHWP